MDGRLVVTVDGWSSAGAGGLLAVSGVICACTWGESDLWRLVFAPEEI